MHHRSRSCCGETVTRAIGLRQSGSLGSSGAGMMAPDQRSEPMSTFSRRQRLASCAAAIAVLLASAVQAEPRVRPAAAGTGTRITTSSFVHVRSKPTASAESVSQLPIGTALTVIERSAEMSSADQLQDYWYRIRLPKGR